MTVHAFLRRASRAAIGLGMAALLASCFFAPGKFTSQLDLRKDGSFTFAYHGEIYMLAVSQMSEMAKKQEFKPEPCHDEEYNERNCTADELKQQRSDWEAQQAGKKAEDQRQMKAMQALLGGIDPSDPKAAQEIVDRLSRQKGWSNVAYKGNGLFTADFSITSTMSHDFQFPVVEGFPMSNSFVIATLRDGNQVRIEAPGFSAQSFTGNPMSGVLEAVEAGKKKPGEDQPQAPKLDGTFTITTDGAILANNTDEGPQPVANGQQLSWQINSRTANAPLALIRLGD
jgi:hypothetical protein